MKVVLNSSQRSLTSHAPQFGGSDQHDSQEFLSFLLDGLHEDLNRILNKPTWQPSPEQEAELERMPQQIASDQQWQIYRMRNDSLIVDFFQGQFRNRLECLTCHSVCRDGFVNLVPQLTSPTDIDNIQQFHVPDAASAQCPKYLEGLAYTMFGCLCQVGSHGENRCLVCRIIVYAYITPEMTGSGIVRIARRCAEQRSNCRCLVYLLSFLFTSKGSLCKDLSQIRSKHS